MKKIITILLMAFAFCGNVQGQLLLNENFEYGNSSANLTSVGANWITHSNASPALGYITSGLSFSAYPSFSGGAATYGTSGQDVNRGFGTTVTSGVVYASFLAVVSNATSGGDYFFHFMSVNNTASTDFKGRVFARSTTGGYNLGISKAGAGATVGFSAKLLGYSTTYMVVVKYTIVNGANNDIADLFVIDGSIPSSEPSIDATAVDAAGNDISGGIGAVALRQGGSSTAATLTIDGIRLAQNWNDAVGIPSSANSITGFTLAGVAGMINGSMINITVPFANNLMGATANGSISANATVNPAFLSVTDFSIPVVFTVTAQNLSTAVYTVTATKMPGSTEASILSFSLAGTSAVIAGNMINVTVPSSVDLTTVSATGSISNLASISPSFSSVTNFNAAVTFTVTAENSTSFNAYTVTAIKAISLSSSKSILGFNIQAQVGSTTFSGTNIFVNVSFGTGLANLTATGSISAAATVNLAFDAANNYTSGLGYTVRAEDSTTQVFTVFVNVLPGSSLKSILGFNIQAQVGSTTFSGTNILVNVPFGTGLANLTATGSISTLATVNPSFATAKSYVAGFVYTVTAQDFTTQDFTILVNMLASVPGLSGITPLSLLRNSLNANGVTTITSSFNISGTILGLNSGGSTRQFILVDATGAIILRGNNLPTTTAEGDVVTVNGLFTGAPNSFGNFNGLLQVNSIVGVSVAATSVARPNPVLVSVLNESSESALVTVIADVDPISWTGAASFTSIININGVLYPMRINSWSEFTSKSFIQTFGAGSNGKNVTITGFGWQFQGTGVQTITGTNPLVIPAGPPFNAGYQLVPYRLSDIKVPAVTIISNAASITGFKLANQLLSSINVLAINVTVPFGTNLATLQAPAELIFSPGSTISPSVTAQQNFSSVVSYTVTSQDLSVKNVYSVSSFVAPYTYLSLPYATDFEVSPLNQGLTFVQVAGARGWTYGKGTGFSNLQASAFSSNAITDLPSESWAIFAYTTSGIAAVGVSMDLLNREFLDNATQKPFQILYSTNYTGFGNPNSSTWNTIAGISLPASVANNNSYANSGIGKFALGNNTSFFLGFKYMASGETSNKTTTWRVDNLTVTSTTIEIPTPPSTLAGFTRIYITANAPLGLASDIDGTVAGANVDFLVASNVTVNGLQLKFSLDPGATASIADGSFPSFLNDGDTYFTSFNVTAEAGNAASYSVRVKVAASLSTSSASELSDLRVYPNPSNGSFTIAAAKASSVEIFNIVGVKVYGSALSSSLSIISLAEPKGVYFLKIAAKSGATVVKRIVID